MLDPFLYLPDLKRKVRISPQALFLMCLAAVERFNQGRGPKGTGKGLDAVGFLLGGRKGNCDRVTHAYPLVSAEAKSDSVLALTANLGPLGKISALCGAGLDYLGIFHSHPGGPATPSQGDREGLGGGGLNLIVGVDAARRKSAWAVNPLLQGLEGAVGGLKFSVGAYRMGEDGVVRSMPVVIMTHEAHRPAGAGTGAKGRRRAGR